MHQLHLAAGDELDRLTPCRVRPVPCRAVDAAFDAVLVERADDLGDARVARVSQDEASPETPRVMIPWNPSERANVRSALTVNDAASMPVLAGPGEHFLHGLSFEPGAAFPVDEAHVMRPDWLGR